MTDKHDSRRQYLTLAALNPRDGKLTAQIQLSYERMQAVGRQSMGRAKECGYTVPMILQKPSAIFEGLNQDEVEERRGQGWRCYCGIPKSSYRADGTEEKPYPGQVFLIFVNAQGVGYSWRWEKADADHPTLPISHKSRFKKRLI